jgi:hypothetical protein
MSAQLPVTLQISLAPGDHRLAARLLSHQVDFWRPCVDEILLTIDTRRSRGRFGDEWENGRRRILEIACKIPGARIVEVDYSPAAQHAVAAAFFGGAPVPAKDCRGGPYYAYFFGLHAAHHDFVLHTDADMFFGGASVPWMLSALALYATQPELLFTAPQPGPPAPDGKLKQLTATRKRLGEHDGYRFTEMSTRLFLFSRARFRERIAALTPRPPAARARLIAWLDGHPAQELPETLFSAAMSAQDLCRFDFAGPAPGCWSLHPPYRSEDFFQKLPALISRIEKSDLPEAQLGDHDFNSSLVDWSEAIDRMAQRRWWHRLFRRLLGSDT